MRGRPVLLSQGAAASAIRSVKRHQGERGMNELEGKAIIVTGATRGIGRAIALEAARRGASVAFNYLKSAEQAAQLKAEIESLGARSMAFQADVADLKSVRQMV